MSQPEWNNWKDLPLTIEAKNGEVIALQAYLSCAKLDGEALQSQRIAEDLLNQSTALARKYTGPEFVLEWLRKAVKLYESKARFET